LQAAEVTIAIAVQAADLKAAPGHAPQAVTAQITMPVFNLALVLRAAYHSAQYPVMNAPALHNAGALAFWMLTSVSLSRTRKTHLSQKSNPRCLAEWTLTAPMRTLTQFVRSGAGLVTVQFHV
jgi:hypothetical protein